MEFEELRAPESVRETVACYTRAGGAGRVEELAEQFHPDAELLVSPGRVAKGRDEIVAMLRAGTASRPPVSHADTKPVIRHFTSNTQFVSVTREKIEAVTYFCAMTAVGDDHWGRYFDIFEPAGDRWLFRRRSAKIEGYVADGWYDANRRGGTAMSRIVWVHEARRDQFWGEFKEVMGGEGALMTYRYLGAYAEIVENRKRASGSLRVRSDMRGVTGLEAAPIVILAADVLGVLANAIAVPAPAQMTLALLDRRDGVSRLGCRAEMVHTGRKQLFGKAVVFDADDENRTIAVYRDSEIVLAPAPKGYERVETGAGVPDTGDLPPLRRAFGGERRRDDGGFAIARLRPAIGSTSASLHHGVTHILLEAAAEEALGSSGGRRRLGYWHATFATRGKTGPFVTRARAVGGDRPLKGDRRRSDSRGRAAADRLGLRRLHAA